MTRTLLIATIVAAAALVAPPLVRAAAAAAPTCPSPNPPDTMTESAGTPQSARLGTAFQTSLAVSLGATDGCPITDPSGVSVTFTAPSSGPSVTFAATGTNTATVGTTGAGGAMAPPMTANDVAGTYTVVATSAYGSVGFTLTNVATAPAAVSAGVGAYQTATVGTAYVVPLAVTVTDADHNPVPGATVTFAAPSSGPSATFSGSGTTATALTDDAGVAVAPALTADDVPGGFVVTATVAGVAPAASFALVNEAPPAARPVAPDIVGMASTADGGGYWLVAADGGVFALGDAPFLGAASAAVALARAGGSGYWITDGAGRVTPLGQAPLLAG